MGPVQNLLANKYTLMLTVVLQNAEGDKDWHDAAEAMLRGDQDRRPLPRASAQRLLMPTQKLIRHITEGKSLSDDEVCKEADRL